MSRLKQKQKTKNKKKTKKTKNFSLKYEKRNGKEGKMKISTKSITKIKKGKTKTKLNVEITLSTRRNQRFENENILTRNLLDSLNQSHDIEDPSLSLEEQGDLVSNSTRIYDQEE